MGSAISSLLLLAMSFALSAPVLAAVSAGPGEAHQAPEIPTAALYTASDFPELARGVDPGFAGEATVQVWAPSQDDWSLTAEGETLALHLRNKPGDATPGWQSLGRITLADGRPLKVVVADDRPRSEDRSRSSRTTSAASKQQRKTQTGEPPQKPSAVPALLCLSAGANPGPAPELDLIRGRTDTHEPSPDRRRSQARTNREGASFQAPASAAAWRDRAAHLREQMLVTLGLWPMFPRTPLKPQVYGKLQRDGYTIEKVVLETFPGFTLSGNLYRPAQATGK